SIDGGAFSSISLTFNEDDVNGADGDQRWANTNFSIDLLAGQSLGTHTLSFYVSATTNGDGAAPVLFDNAGGANYNTSFTVVPEPSTWAMMLAGLGLLVGVQRRRRRLS
ncbi:MAG: PEP-CTERM sorting domain-containing protein, partial [Blastocatellia bacterium]|nr:PEP-CTERM sorting domain-containing protein [Blastocatellia bacterium]